MAQIGKWHRWAVELLAPQPGETVLEIGCGHGIATGLLKDALLRSLQISQQVGCRAVLVHALDEEAAAFYAAYGFTPFPAGGGTFFMAIKSIAAALYPPSLTPPPSSSISRLIHQAHP